MQASLSHFQRLLGPHGLYQHATRQEPLLSEGYCTDDNARAVQLLVVWLHSKGASQPAVLKELLDSCWQFLLDAHRPDGTYYNFRSAEGTWLPHDISEDMYGRLARAYATVIRYDPSAERQAVAEERLQQLEPIFHRLQFPRGWAETVLAYSILSAASLSASQKKLIETHTHNLTALYHQHAAAAWSWFEPTMTYANALLPHGLLASHRIAPDPAIETILHQTTDFLITSTIRNNIFIPIGSNGWYPRGGTPSIDNQQAIEAGTMFDFLLAYNTTFPGRLAADTMLAPYLWFFGANTNNQLMANPEIGACYDGLFITGPNVNYGAESMLAYLWSELLVNNAPPELQNVAAQRRDEVVKK